jgi:hypothetical protein
VAFKTTVIAAKQFLPKLLGCHKPLCDSETCRIRGHRIHALTHILRLFVIFMYKPGHMGGPYKHNPPTYVYYVLHIGCCSY